MASLTDALLRDTRANQPAATGVGSGTLYCVSDEGDILEQSDGAAWTPYSPVPGDFADLGDIPDTLAAIAALTGSAGKGIELTGTNTAATFDLTAAGKALLDDADAAAQRTTLGLGTVSTLDVDTDTTLAANSDAKIASQKAVKAFVAAMIAALVNSSPSTLDTLKELADALGDDPNFATTIATALGLKAPLASPTFTGTVTVPSPTNPTDATDKSYVDSAVGGAAVSAIDDIGDVIITSPANGDALIYEAASSKWKNQPVVASTTEVFTDVAKSADYTIVSGDKGKTFVCTNTITLTLPSAADKFWFGVYNAGTGTVVVGSLIRMLPGEWIRVVSDGTSFFIIDSQLTYSLTSLDRPPVTRNVADDEFDTGSSIDTAGTRRSGATAWTARDITGLTNAVSGGILTLTRAATSATIYEGYTQPFPGSGNPKYRTKYYFGGYNQNYNRHGLALERGSGSSRRVVHMFVSQNGALSVERVSGTADTWNSSPSATPSLDPLFPYWLEIEYSGTNFILRHYRNQDRPLVLWTEAESTWLGGRADRIAILMMNGNGSGAMQSDVDWFRRVA
jgi:hypothetical protein